MSNDNRTNIQDLAYHMWKSAGEEYGRAIDFWLMAETMVTEVAASATRLTQASVAAATTTAMTGPPMVRAAYVEHVGALAHAMWRAAGTQAGSALDFWLAAERHVRTLAERTARATGASFGAEETVARIFEAFSPEAYLEEIRKIAYGIWESAGNQYGSALDCWLAAEQQFLETRIAMVPVKASAARRKWSAAAAPENVIEPARKPATPAASVTTEAATPMPAAAAPKPAAARKPAKRAPAAPKAGGGGAGPGRRGKGGGPKQA